MIINNQDSKMDDELLKRNTDCVYFLASPFTCKKGVECEYRHSDMARLNPRDCWYWLSGSCLNPTCAFRHPPLEIHTEATPNASASLVSQPSVPATRSTVPCYFYFYGFCKKGDRCPFLHEPDESHSSKPMMANTISDIPIQSLDAKTSRSDQETAPEKNSPSLFEMAVKGGDGFQVQQKQHVQQQALNDMLTLSTHAHACAPDCEETAVVDAPLLQPVEVSPESECEPILDSDPSSEELIDGNIVRDEWCESSPGFDVLVDGEAEDITYEDDPEYLCAGNDGDHEGVIMQHGVDENDYDERIFFRNRLYDSSDLIYGEHRADLGEYSPRRSKNRKGGRVSHKRKLLPMEFPVGGCNFMDLRDYLRKRRTVDGYLETQSWRHVMVHRRRDESLQRHSFNQQLRGRVAAKFGRNGVGLARRRTLAIEAYQRGRRRSSLRYKSRESVNGIKRRRLPNEGKRRSSMKRECDPPVSNTFDGPKSLAEIKEESRRGCSNGNGSVDFDGPKPLSEILKAKKQPTSTSNGEVSGSF